MLDQVAGERELGNVEVAAAHGPQEHFLRVEQHVHRVDAIDLDPAVIQRAGAVVVAQGDGELPLGHG